MLDKTKSIPLAIAIPTIMVMAMVMKKTIVKNYPLNLNFSVGFEVKK